jgi:hypothetical protein
MTAPSTKTILIAVGISGFAVFVIAIWTAAIVTHRSRPQAVIALHSASPTSRADYSPPEASQTAVVISPTVIPISEAKLKVSLTYKWYKGGLDNIMLVDFEFVNPTPYAAKDISVTCTHYGPSGTEIDSNTRTIYEVVPPKGKKKINDFNMGFIHAQASSTVCKINDLEM